MIAWLLFAQEEEIYQVPSRDMDGLYSQLMQIRVPSLSRESIGYIMHFNEHIFMRVTAI
jgi:hypothetical protein